MDKKRWIILLVSIITMLILIICIVSWRKAIKTGPDPVSHSSSVPNTTSTSVYTSTQTSSIAATETSVTRILGQWEGQLALFYNGNTTPDKVYEVYLVSLPEEEQQRLKAGIPIKDDTALAKLLEDYTS
jgi:hypothetical protein